MKNIGRLVVVFSLITVIGAIICCVPVSSESGNSLKVVSWGLSLGDDICVRFHIDIPGGVSSNANIVCNVGEYSITCPVSESAMDTDGNIIIPVHIAAAQMTDEIKLLLIDGENQLVAKTYCVRDYTRVILEGSYDNTTKAMVKEMLNYGAKAQAYFGYNTEKPANAGYEIETASQALSQSLPVTMEGNIDGIRFYGASLVYASKVAVRFYFAADSVEGINFLVDETAYEAISKDGLYYVEIPGIYPQAYEDAINLVVSDGADSLSIGYSPMHYITRMYNKASSGDALRELMQAMYGYYRAACSYTGEDVSVEELDHKFYIDEHDGIITADPQAGTFQLAGGSGFAGISFAANRYETYASQWEILGTVTKENMESRANLSFGVIDSTGKEQWFTVYTDSLSLQKEGDFLSGKYACDGAVVTYNQASTSFYWNEAYRNGIKLDYSLYLYDDTLHVYFGNDQYSLSRSWFIPLTEDNFGGFSANSQYKLVIGATAGMDLSFANVAVNTGAFCEKFPAYAQNSEYMVVTKSPNVSLKTDGFEIDSSEDRAEIIFAANETTPGSDAWEVSGIIQKQDYTLPMFLSFGVKDRSGKDQWFCILDESIACQRYWNWWNTKLLCDDEYIYYNQAATEFFYHKEENTDNLAFKIVVAEDVLYAYFGSDTQGMTLAWSLPLTDSRFGGFAPGSQYTLGMNTVDPNNASVTELSVKTGANVAVGDVVPRFFVDETGGDITYDTCAGTVTAGGTGNTEIYFKATSAYGYAYQWEMSGTITKKNQDDNLFLSFGVRNLAGKDQWFCILDDAMSLSRYWNWWDYKYPCDNCHVFYNQAATDFFYHDTDSLDYRLVLEKDTLTVFFGNDTTEMKLAWILPLTEETFGGFIPDQPYQLAINSVDPAVFTISDVTCKTEKVDTDPVKLYLREDLFVRDPWILVDDGTYYLYGTRSFGYFDVFSSKDLEIWEEHEPCFDPPDDFWANAAVDSDLPNAMPAYWAPEVYKYTYRGETAYYMIASFTKDTETMNQQACAILKADSPLGPFEIWSEDPNGYRGTVTMADHSCIDGTLYFENGIPYMIYVHQWPCQCRNFAGIGTMCYVQLSPDLKTTVGEATEWFAASDLVSASDAANGAHVPVVTDGPTVYVAANGEKYLLWATAWNGAYKQIATKFTSVTAPIDILNDSDILYGTDGGHGMIFTDLNGKETFILHAPNSGATRARIFDVIVSEEDLDLVPRN